MSGGARGNVLLIVEGIEPVEHPSLINAINNFADRMDVDNQGQPHSLEMLAKAATRIAWLANEVADKTSEPRGHYFGEIHENGMNKKLVPKSTIFNLFNLGSQQSLRGTRDIY